MNIINKKIGIWGYGVMGKSAVQFFSKKNCTIGLLEQRKLLKAEKQELQRSHIKIVQKVINNFLTSYDIILPSSGIDVHSYKQFHHKFVTELDLFQAYFKKPIIAITGTLGKTTVTQHLAKLLKVNGLNIVIGGNIGIGLFDLIDQQDTIDYAVIEVSSFQLEYCKTFAPDLAIWTNFYPNHLDRHETMKDYFAAKMKIFEHQNNGQKALVAQNVYDNLSKEHQKKVIVFNDKKLPKDLSNLPGFKKNWTICFAALQTLELTFRPDLYKDLKINPIEHRLEKLTTINGIIFYNDSKSTVPEATLAAIENLKTKNILLFLGGLSKGIDRESLIKTIKNKVKKVYCFGKEAEQLFMFCKKYSINATMFATLDKAFTMCIKEAQQGEVILFSPSGASFDLFKNYQERGNYFKHLVKKLSKNV